MRREQDKPSFIKEVQKRKDDEKQAKHRRKEVEEVARRLHADLSAIVFPHLPSLAKEPRPRTEEELLDRLSKISMEEMIRPIQDITRSMHEVKGSITSDDGSIDVTVEIDGYYEFRRDQALVITVDGLPDRYSIYTDAIHIESIDRELPPGVEPVFGGPDQTRPVRTRWATNKDIAMLEDLAIRLADPAVELTHSSYPKRY